MCLLVTDKKYKTIRNLVSHVWIENKFVPIDVDNIDVVSACVGLTPIMFSDVGYSYNKETAGPYYVSKCHDQITLFHICGVHDLSLGKHKYVVDSKLCHDGSGLLLPLSGVDKSLLFSSGCAVTYDETKNYIYHRINHHDVIFDNKTGLAIGELDQEGTLVPLSLIGIKMCEDRNVKMDHSVLKTPGITFSVSVSEDLFGEDYSGYDSDPQDVVSDVKYHNNYQLELFFPYMTSVPNDYKSLIKSRVDKWGGYTEYGDHGMSASVYPRRVTRKTLAVTSIQSTDHNGVVVLRPTGERGVICMTCI